MIQRLPETLLPWVRRYWPEGSVSALPEPARPDDISIVTAFFDIGRADWRTRNTGEPSIFVRSSDTYFACFRRLAKIKNQIIVFVAEAHAPRVLAARQAAGLEGQTVIFTIEDLFGQPEIAAVERALQSTMSPGFRAL